VLISVCGRFDYDPEQYAGASSIPILVIGTKIDLAQTVRETSYFRSSPIADECGADEIQLVISMLPSDIFLNVQVSIYLLFPFLGLHTSEAHSSRK
jgi:hypothetical protein